MQFSRKLCSHCGQKDCLGKTSWGLWLRCTPEPEGGRLGTEGQSPAEPVQHSLRGLDGQEFWLFQLSRRSYHTEQRQAQVEFSIISFLSHSYVLFFLSPSWYKTKISKEYGMLLKLSCWGQLGQCRSLPQLTGKLVESACSLLLINCSIKIKTCNLLS